MAGYKLYTLDCEGKIDRAPRPIRAEFDDQAIKFARALRLQTTCEIWEGARLVARIDPSA